MIQLKKRQHHSEQAKKLTTLCCKNPNDFWKYWKKLHRNRPNYDHIDIDTFSSYYKQVDQKLTDVNFDDLFMKTIYQHVDEIGDGEYLNCPDPINDILNGPILLEEVCNAIKQSKNNVVLYVQSKVL